MLPNPISKTNSLGLCLVFSIQENWGKKKKKNEATLLFGVRDLDRRALKVAESTFQESFLIVLFNQGRDLRRVRHGLVQLVCMKNSRF